jgi:hypothetical protein
MSQFRIKHIDQGLIDEFVPRKNEEGIQLGDDVDARDPNELAEAILDVQEVILKTSTLAANAILKPTSGLAERLTILEATAGQATLQDIYENGNYISILSGRPLVLGAREEIKIDDAGNLSFKAVSMRVKGSGNAYVELSNQAVFSTLGDLLVGAVSPGANLTVRSGGNMFFQDNYLTSPVTLSQSGSSQLATVSQSIVGAINELKSSTFSVSLQSVYNQSSPPKVITNIAAGALTIEDANANSVGDAFKVAGNATVTKKLTVGNLRIGNNCTIADSTGIVTTDKIKSGVEVETPKINSGLSELILQDKRGSFQLSEATAAALATNSNTIIGAINELKTNITNVGNSIITYDQQHNASTGEHGIITTQAAAGQNSTKRFVVKNQAGSETFSITGNGDVVANGLTLSSMNVVSLLTQLIGHLTDDGTSHTAFANHLVADNPHNTVRTILNLRGNVILSSPDGSVNVSTSGNTINLTTVDLSDLQSVYQKATLKRILLDNTGFTFRDNASSTDIMTFLGTGITAFKNIVLPTSTIELKGTQDLNLRGTVNANIFADTGDINLSTSATQAVKLQGVPFDETAVKTLPTLAGTSVLGNLKQLDDDKTIGIYNSLEINIPKGTAVCMDAANSMWFPITTVHPANEFVTGVNWYFTNRSNVYIAAENVSGLSDGKFYKSGMITATLATGLDTWKPNTELYLGYTGYSDIEILAYANMVNNQTITIEPGELDQIITGVTGVPNVSTGSYKIENTANANLDCDKTRDNIVALLNDPAYYINPGMYKVRAAIDGEATKATVRIGAALVAGNIVELQSATVGGATVTFTAVAEASTPTYLQFRVGNSVEECAYNIAELINKTTFYRDAAGTLVGHYCYAEAKGALIRLTFYKPGFAGRTVNIATNTANVTISQMSGGTCKARIFRQDLGTDVLTLASSNPTGVSVTNLISNETAAQYIIADRALSKRRQVTNENKTRVGLIEAATGNVVKFRVKV